MAEIQIPEPKLSRFIFTDTRMGWFWLVVRLYIGYEWLIAGWDKFISPAWTGANAGVAVKGFLMGALQKTTGAHPDVSSWYASFISNTAIHHTAFLSYLVTYGEMAVGIGLILGAFTGLAAFFGVFMNLNYLLAGTVSTNPVLMVIGLFLMLAWRNAGSIGLDRFILSFIGVPWRPGTLFRSHKHK